jgi:hypothetical protein
MRPEIKTLSEKLIRGEELLKKKMTPYDRGRVESEYLSQLHALHIRVRTAAEARLYAAHFTVYELIQTTRNTDGGVL